MQHTADAAPRPGRNRRRSRLMLWIALGGIAMVVGYTAVFLQLMAQEGRSYTWPSALYWTITTMSTLGYGDITFTTDTGRLFSMVVLISGVILILVLLPYLFVQFVVTPWIDQRAAARTPRSAPPSLRGHIILAGLDVVNQALIARAKRSSTPTLVLVEDPAEAARLHDEGYKVMVGSLDSPATYRRAGVDRALMVAATQADTTNTNLAFTVRQVSKDVRIAVTADKEASVDVLQLAGANHVLQLGAVLGRELTSRIQGTTGGAHVIGSFGETLVAEAAARGTSLVGATLEEATREMACRLRILAVMRRGKVRPFEPAYRIDEQTILIVAGSKSDLAAYEDTFRNPQRPESPALILGGGRVGRAAADTLEKTSVPYTIVEQVPGRTPAHHNVVEGDAADLAVLQSAGLAAASSALITTHDDDLNVYLTIYCRRLRPDLQIVARASYERNVATLYRAGADAVLSYATIGATALWNELGRSHRVVIAEGNELFQVPLPPALVGTAIRDRSIHETTGCHIVAAADSDGTLLPDSERVPAGEGATLLLLGDRHAERTFRKRYLKKHR